MPDLQVVGVEAGVRIPTGQVRITFSDDSTLELSRAQLDALCELPDA